MDLIVRLNGEERRVTVEREGDGYRVGLGDRRLAVGRVEAVGSVRSLLLDGEQHEVSVRASGDGTYRVTSALGERLVEVLDPLTHLARVAHAQTVGSGPRTVVAYMPGRVVAVLVEEGAEVRQGSGVVVLEAMKMENEIQADHDGVVRRLHVQPGQAVEGGDPLFDLD